MKFIHLSDLHIGKKVNDFSMMEDQKYILSQIIEIIKEQKVEGVWIAGDIYDKSIPSAEAVQLFDEFLTKLARLGLPVFAISGNHDSAERIAFGARLMNTCRVYMSPVYDGNISPVILQDDYGEIAIYLLPFIRPALARHVFDTKDAVMAEESSGCKTSAITTYQDAVSAAIEHMLLDEKRRNVLLSHQFVTGAVQSGSEDISVGGVDNIDSRLFDGFDYVALGHIHNAQAISRETIRYCGTPLKYSFSEAGHTKYAVIVTMKEKGNVQIEEIPLTPLHDLREIKGSYQEITARDFYKDMPVRDYLHITLTDEEDILDAIGKLRSIYPNIMKLDYDNTRTRKSQHPDYADNGRQRNPLQLLQEFYEFQNNQPMSAKQSDYVRTIIEDIWEVEK